MTWTREDIDAAIPTIKAKRDECRAKGDHLAAERHNRWIDRLLEARSYQEAKS